MKFWGVQNIVYSSTAGVYESKKDAIKEDDKVNPMNNPYAASKYSAELAIRLSGVNYVIFRYFNLAGADPENEMGECHEPETHLIPRILQNLNNFTINGNNYDTPDGTCIRDYVHVTDIAEAHSDAGKYLLNGGKSTVMNLGTGQGLSILQVINELEKVTGKKVNYTVQPRRSGDADSLIADISLAREVLNYRPKYDIMTILETAYKWQTSNEKRA